MKKLIILAILFCLSFNLISQKKAKERMNAILDQLYPTISVKDFKNIVNGEKKSQSSMVEMMDGYMSFKLQTEGPTKGYVGLEYYETRFIYFKDNSLYRIDEGERPTDLKIEIDKKIKKIISD